MRVLIGNSLVPRSFYVQPRQLLVLVTVKCSCYPTNENKILHVSIAAAAVKRNVTSMLDVIKVSCVLQKLV